MGFKQGCEIKICLVNEKGKLECGFILLELSVAFNAIWPLCLLGLPDKSGPLVIIVVVRILFYPE